MYIPAVSTNCGFHESIYLLFFTYKVRHRSGSRAHWKKILNFVQFSFRFSPFKIKLTLPASASLSKHKRIKCYPKNCKHVYKIGTIVVKKEKNHKKLCKIFDRSVLDRASGKKVVQQAMKYLCTTE